MCSQPCLLYLCWFTIMPFRDPNTVGLGIGHHINPIRHCENFKDLSEDSGLQEILATLLHGFICLIHCSSSDTSKDIPHSGDEGFFDGGTDMIMMWLMSVLAQLEKTRQLPAFTIVSTAPVDTVMATDNQSPALMETMVSTFLAASTVSVEHSQPV